MSPFIIARMTFQEARQRRLLWVVGVMSVIFLTIFGVGFYHMQRDISAQAGERLPEANNILLMTGLYVVNFLVVVLAVVISVNTIAGEIASGTIQTIVTKPLRRWEVVVGKWLGLAGMLALFTVTMGAAMMGIVWTMARYLPPNPAEGIALMTLVGLVVLTLSVLGSTRFSTLANGVVVFMLYGLAFIAGWIHHAGTLTGNHTARWIGVVVSWVVPCEAMWKRAAYLMQPPFLRELGVSPFASVDPPGAGMVVYAALYTALALAAAVWVFERRDL